MSFSRKDKTFKCCTRNINVVFLCRKDDGFMMIVDVLEVHSSVLPECVLLSCLTRCPFLSCFLATHSCSADVPFQDTVLEPIPSFGQNLVYVPATPLT